MSFTDAARRTASSSKVVDIRTEEQKGLNVRELALAHALLIGDKVYHAQD